MSNQGVEGFIKGPNGNQQYLGDATHYSLWLHYLNKALAASNCSTYILPHDHDLAPADPAALPQAILDRITAGTATDAEVRLSINHKKIIQEIQNGLARTMNIILDSVEGNVKGIISDIPWGADCYYVRSLGCSI